ncbi:MAG: Flp pilus assembly protein CpaB [Verrucomicrobiae bacterium]|nr:Flp pilus assembly protein CpaB [Verrucomicrobiae bacterium]
MKQKIILLIALLSGIAAFVLSRQNFENFKVKFQSQFATVRVVAAARNLPPGTTLKMSDIGTKTVFQKNVVGRAIRPDEYTEIINRKTRTFLQEGDPILWSDIEMPFAGAGGLASMIEIGQRAISIPVDNIANVSGLVKPNDHVDILGTFTFPPGVRGTAPAAPGAGHMPDTVTLTILQDVTVLACGRNMSRRTLESEAPERFGGDQYSSVTISVTPREAEMLVFAHNKGKLTLALRNREDVSMPPLTESVDFAKLEKNFGQLNALRQQRLHPTPGGFSPLPAPAPASAPATPAPAATAPAPTPAPAGGTRP